MAQPARVLIVDDNAYVRRGVAHMLAGHCFLCGEAGNGVEAVEMVRTTAPDLVLLDVNMPVMGGREAAREIHQLSPATKVILMSVDDSPRVAALMKSTAAEGFISKNSDSKTFAAAVDAVISDISS